MPKMETNVDDQQPYIKFLEQSVALFKAQSEHYASFHQQIALIGLGPDRGSPQWQIDCARELAEKALKEVPNTCSTPSKWRCPIQYSGCEQNCGSYVCGN